MDEEFLTEETESAEEPREEKKGFFRRLRIRRTCTFVYRIVDDSIHFGILADSHPFHSLCYTIFWQKLLRVL